MKTRKIALLGCMLACSTVLWGGNYQYVSTCAGSGTYEIVETGTDFVMSGNIDGDVTVTLPKNCRVTLSGVTMSGVLTINGDAELWLVGESEVAVAGASVIVCSGTLTIGGTGKLEASAAGAKKTGVISATSLEVAGGATTLTIANPTAKNACGISLSGDYVQTDGTLTIVGTSNDYKQNGVFLSKKNTTATISGGTLDVTLAGEKSVGLAMDKASISGTMSGGALKFTMSGNGAKGVKGDGTFTMTGGTLDATLTGGVAEDYFEYEDGNGVTWNYYVTLTSSTMTSGGTAIYNTSSLIANGTYPVMDPSKCYAVKVGTLDISGGAVTVSATGTAGRGLGANNMTLSGGTYDITVAGGPTAVYVESLVESDDLDDTTYTSGVATCLDAGGAACLKTSGTNSLMTISGGTFDLKATGDAGKLINAAGYLVIGKEGQATLPSDASFSPNINGSTTGSKVYCTAVKQKYYGSLAVAVASTNLSDIALSTASENLVATSPDTIPPNGEQGGFGGGTPPDGGQGGPGGNAPPDGGQGGGPGGNAPPDGGQGEPGGGDDNADYSNPKGVKGYAGVTIHGGRLVITTKNDGGEGLESKKTLIINGGIIDLQCYDDCINSGGDLYINGGYIYALSSGNDSIDSNSNIYMSGGIVLAFSTAGGAEVGIDTDNQKGLVVSGGHLVAVGGAAGNMVVGSSGSQKTYKNTSLSASTYSGKYLSMTGAGMFSVKMPTLSGTISLVCTTEGWNTAGTPSASATVPGFGAIGFHDVCFYDYDADAPTTVPSTLWPADAAFNGTSTTVYDGWILNEDGTLAGTIQVKAGKANTSTRTFSATATVKDANAKTWSYSKGLGVASGASKGVLAGLTNTVKGATVPSFSVTLGANGMRGTWGGLEIVGARNGMGVAKDAMKTALETRYKKSWTTGFTNDTGVTRLRFVVDAKGAVKISGDVATNLTASATSQAVMGENALYIPYLATIKKGANVHYANMLLKIPADNDGTFSADNASFGTLVAAGETVTDAIGTIECSESAMSKGGEAFSAVVSVDDLAYPVKFTASGLPAGLKINATTGEIYGTPTKPGSYTAKVTVASVANSKTKTTVSLAFDIANYTDDLIQVDDTYSDCRVGVKVYKPLADVAAGCTVSGLPAGLKFVTKDTKDSTYGFGVVPAYTIYGVPTKAATNTVYFKRSVKETNTLGRTATVTHMASATFAVAPLHAWAQGTFNGAVADDTGTNTVGLVSAMTVGTTGKFSGKILADGVSYSIAATAYDVYDEATSSYTAAVIGKQSKNVFTNVVTVTEGNVNGSTIGLMSSGAWSAWQNLWKTEPWKTAAKSFANKTLTTKDGVALKFAASGAVTAKYLSYSCSTTLIPAGSNTYSVFVYFPPKTGKFDGYSAEIPVVWNGGDLAVASDD